MKLTTAQRVALALLSDPPDPRYTEGVVYAGENTTFDGQPWINYRTAQALVDRGLAVIDSDYDNSTVRLAPRLEGSTTGEAEA